MILLQNFKHIKLNTAKYTHSHTIIPKSQVLNDERRKWISFK